MGIFQMRGLQNYPSCVSVFLCSLENDSAVHIISFYQCNILFACASELETCNVIRDYVHDGLLVHFHVLNV